MSFLNQMVMADQLYQQQQKEREDREFELLKRKQEQAELAQKAYLMPFETKELQAQYEDKANERANAEEQKAFNKWMTPYEPQIGMNDDGTRQLDVRVPVAPAVAGLMAAGLGTMGNNVEDFIRPFNDQAINVSREYNTPDEIKTKADAEAEHKRALELAGARKANPRPPSTISSRSSSQPRSAGSVRQSPQTGPDYRADKRFNGFYEKIFSQFVGNYMEKNNKSELTAEEFAEIGSRADAATAAALGYYSANGTSPAATTPTPKPPAQPTPPATAPQSPQSADEAAAEEDLNVFLPPAKTSKSVSAPQRQASRHEALSPNASPTLFDDYLNFYGAPPISPPSRPPAQLASESAPIVPFSPRPASLASAPAVAPAVAPARQPTALPAAAPSSAQIGAMGPAPKSGDLESQQREIIARQIIARAKDDEWVEGYNQLASAAELQLGRRLTDDERAYLANAVEAGSIGGIADVEFDWSNGSFRARGEEQWRPISDALSSVDFTIRDFFNNNWLNRKTRDFENYLESKAKK